MPSSLTRYWMRSATQGRHEFVSAPGRSPSRNVVMEIAALGRKTAFGGCVGPMSGLRHRKSAWIAGSRPQAIFAG